MRTAPLSAEPDPTRDRMKALSAKAWRGLGILALTMAVILFGAAGTIAYWQAWAYLAAFFVPAISITLYLIENDPALLERRANAGPTAEKEPAQKVIMSLAMIGFIGLITVPALDHRFDWSTVPVNLVLIGDLMVILGFYLVFLVYKENSFQLGDDRGRARSKGDFHRTLCGCPPSDVRRQPSDADRYPARARLLLGPPGACCNDAGADLAAPRRGAVLGQEPARLPGLLRQSTLANDTGGLLDSEGAHGLGETGAKSLT